MAKKKFFYKITSTRKQRTGGRKQSADVYQMKYSNLNYVGEANWNTASYKGEESEVYGMLYRKKLVPVREYKKEGGYYSYRNKGVSIKKV